MTIQELAVADGKIESVRTSAAHSEILFSDWQERKWLLAFVDVLAVENLNIEEEELDRVEVRDEDPYIERIRYLVNKPNAVANVYMFFTPWNDEPRLRVVAGDCNVMAARP